jgi:hypothetical protein
MLEKPSLASLRGARPYSGHTGSRCPVGKVLNIKLLNIKKLNIKLLNTKLLNIELLNIKKLNIKVLGLLQGV